MLSIVQRKNILAVLETVNKRKKSPFQLKMKIENEKRTRF